MPWYDVLNPLNWELGQPPPPPASIQARDPSGALNPDGTPKMITGQRKSGLENLYDTVVHDGFGGPTWEGTKDVLNKPYQDKAKGYDAIRAETDRLKKERMGQKDFAYNLADSKYEPTRKAIQALYGDPASWKL